MSGAAGALLDAAAEEALVAGDFALVTESSKWACPADVDPGDPPVQGIFVGLLPIAADTAHPEAVFEQLGSPLRRADMDPPKDWTSPNFGAVAVVAVHSCLHSQNGRWARWPPKPKKPLWPPTSVWLASSKQRPYSCHQIDDDHFISLTFRIFFGDFSRPP
jgi:hypothetical protein